MEGNYTFSLPGRALISDFAVWDGVTRIPGVILERRRAEEIYAEAKAQVIDPGLLQQGERDADEARRTSVFSAHIVPIPAFGTKRVEMEYQERTRWSRCSRCSRCRYGLMRIGLPRLDDCGSSWTCLHLTQSTSSKRRVRFFR